jgi:hypothetical protein
MRITEQIMKTLKVDLAEATEIHEVLDDYFDVDYSECTMRELNAAIRNARDLRVLVTSADYRSALLVEDCE